MITQPPEQASSNSNNSVTTTPTTSAISKINVVINGAKQTYQQPPVIQNGSTLVPLRGIFETLGATVNWDGTTQTVTATKETIKVVLQIGSKTPTVNGQTKEISVAAQIINGSTMVPLRFVSEALGAEVTWDGETRTIAINLIISQLTKHDTIKEIRSDTKTRFN